MGGMQRLLEALEVLAPLLRGVLQHRASGLSLGQLYRPVAHQQGLPGWRQRGTVQQLDERWQLLPLFLQPQSDDESQQENLSNSLVM
jgi:hypothetical protein